VTPVCAQRRPMLIDEFLPKLEEWVDGSRPENPRRRGTRTAVRVAHAGSQRTTRHAVTEAKMAWRVGRRRCIGRGCRSQERGLSTTSATDRLSPGWPRSCLCVAGYSKGKALSMRNRHDPSACWRKTIAGRARTVTRSPSASLLSIFHSAVARAISPTR
jgi:hypothetical protein